MVQLKLSVGIAPECFGLGRGDIALLLAVYDFQPGRSGKARWRVL